jgi:membrane protein DedA with SNARE-associated domain
VNISPKFAAFAAAPFALICFGFALSGYLQLDQITDPELMGDAKGYIGFWLFLAGIAVISGVLSWWMMAAQEQKDRE